MSSPRTSARPAPAWRRALALWVGLAALAGALELHPGGEGLGGLAFGGQERVAECHPDLAQHLDAPVLILHPRCPACLLHQSTQGAFLPAHAGLLAALPPCGTPADHSLPTLRFPGHRAASRGPPLA